MKNSFLSATILALGLIALPPMAQAQQYIPPATYSGANVIVNMDVLNPAPMPAPMPLQAQRRGLRSPAEARANVPLRLRRPASAPHQAKAPMAAPTVYPSFGVSKIDAPIHLKQPTPNAVASTPLAPLTPPSDPTRTEIVPEFAAAKKAPALIATPKAPAPTFSAKELVKAAEKTKANPPPVMAVKKEPLTTPPAAVTQAAREIVDITPQATPKTGITSHQRSLLAKAREEVLYDTTKAVEDTKKEIAETVKIPVVPTMEPVKKEAAALKNDITTAATKTVAEIENIAPSAPKMAPIKEAIPPMPTTPTLLKAKVEEKAPSLPPVQIAPVVKAPAVPTLEPIVKLEEEPVKMAALTTSEATKSAPSVPEIVAADQKSFRLLFDQTSADLQTEDTIALDQIAARLTNSDGTKIQLRAFANGTPETSSKARRLSLTRALTVRSYLLDKGVSATSMDVRALGTDKSADAPADRVDIVFVR